jgi:hypothetical protein
VTELLQVRTRSATTVKELVRLWHSSHSAPAGFRIAFLLVDGGDTIGVSTWGRPVARMEDQKTTLEHTRMALGPGCPANSASWFLAANRRVIREEMPEIVRLISYVDGSIHSGVSYRADNWREVARAVPTDSWGTREGRSGRPCALRVKFERRP